MVSRTLSIDNTIAYGGVRNRGRLSFGVHPFYNSPMSDTGHIDDAAWDRLVKNLLRAEMMRKGVSYEVLVEKLAAIGVSDNVANLRNKVARGRFTASFFAQCMVALGVDLLAIPKADDVSTNAADAHGAQALAKRTRAQES